MKLARIHLHLRDYAAGGARPRARCSCAGRTGRTPPRRGRSWTASRASPSSGPNVLGVAVPLSGNVQARGATRSCRASSLALRGLAA